MNRHGAVTENGHHIEMLAADQPRWTASVSDAVAAGRRVLIIEDEAEAAAHLLERLPAEGWEAEHVSDGESGLARAKAGAFDVILVDRMLPSRDGLSVVEELRKTGDATPVLFMTAMGAVADRVAGFKGGGDDYLVKPFSFEELDARLHALVRRRLGPPAERVTLRIRDLEINRLERAVRRGALEVDLMPLEYRLLEFLVLRAGQVVTRAMLLEGVWGFRFDPRTNIVETHISRLRAKLDQAESELVITTVRGAGYVVHAD